MGESLPIELRAANIISIMTVTYTPQIQRERERERGGLKERKNRLLKIFNCDDCLVMKVEICLLSLPLSFIPHAAVLTLSINELLLQCVCATALCIFIILHA